ncbi:MAG: response regulator [Desulfovibrionaceae bacterium]|nr:response regulator [Desulfovibrionaceae bacterium]MBF0513781.1 response regulator [Desulfovibrionaceae bacterium]
MDLTATILLVDDFQVVRKTLKHHLRAMGFVNFEEAGDGNMALEVLEQKKVDLVLLDWNMPVKSGFELLKEVRTKEEFNKLPIIMLTAEGTEEAVTQAVLAGATNYIVKPFNFDTLAKKITQVMGKKSK